MMCHVSFVEKALNLSRLKSWREKHEAEEYLEGNKVSTPRCLVINR